MNPEITSEILRLKKEVARANEWVGELDKRIARLEALAARVEPVPDTSVAEIRSSATPPPLPLKLAARPESAPPARPAGVTLAAPPTPAPPPSVPPPPDAPPAPAAAKPSQPAEAFEWRLGAYWLGRIGIVVLLTGLVFLGNFVWTKYIQSFGPWGKLAVYALCSAALGILGLRMEARSEPLRNFGRVLLAGGMALGYYTTYASHFVERLRVIKSPVLGGVLLLAAAGLLARFADRRRSQGTAMLAVLLAFYTAAMNPIAGFSLFSNALLCGVALFFLWRHQWTGLTWISMAGSYAAFGFWRFHQSGLFVWGTGLAPDQFWTSRGFLFTYWVLFTLAFLNRRQAFSPEKRACGFAANNGAFFAYMAPSLHLLYPGQFWIFPLVFGAVLFGLSRLSARLHEGEHLVEGSLLFQGVALVVLGLGARLHGWQLSLCLGLMSTLLLRNLPRHLQLLGLGCALGVSLVAMLMGLNAPSPSPGWAWNLLFLAGLFLAQAVMVRRWHPDSADGNRGPAIYGFLSFMTICAWSAQFYSDVLGRLEWSGAVMAGLGLALMAASTPLRMRELLGVSQLWLGLGVFEAMHASMQYLPPHSGVMALVCLAPAACWRWYCHEPRESRALGEGLWTLVSLCWLHDLLTAYFGEPSWAVVGTVLCLLLVAAGIFARSPGAFVASVVYQVSAALAALGDSGSRIRMLALLAGAVAFAFLHLAPRLQPRIRSRAEGEVAPAPPAALFSVWLYLQTLLVCLLWASGILREGPGEHWKFTGLALAATLCLAGIPAVVLRRIAAGWFGFLAVALCALLLLQEGRLPLANAAGLLLLVGVERWMCRDRAARATRWHPVFIGLITLGWIVHVHHWMERAGASPTVGVAVLAALVLAFGFAVKEQRWRIAGLACFGLALLRVFALDVWAFDTLGRILSFLVLGVALLGVGFLYNHLKPRIREWTREG